MRTGGREAVKASTGCGHMPSFRRLTRRWYTRCTVDFPGINGKTLDQSAAVVALPDSPGLLASHEHITYFVRQHMESKSRVGTGRQQGVPDKERHPTPTPSQANNFVASRGLAFSFPHQKAFH